MSATDLSRRAVLFSGLAVGGGLFVALAPPRAFGSAFAPLNAFVRIQPDGAVRLTLARAEMGQGVSTSLVMLLAEELDAPLERVTIDQAPADIGKYGLQITGGSTSVSSSYESLRRAGAAARALLVAEAAARWNASAGECVTEPGMVVHRPSGRRLAYGDLATGAAARPAPSDPPLKDPKDFRLIGQPTNRLDARDRLDGSVRYGIDARPPGMKFAVSASPPWMGGEIESVDAAATLATPGVIKVVRTATGVAVIADNTFAALKGREALKITWKRPPGKPLDSAQVYAALEAAVASDGAVAIETPGLKAALSSPGPAFAATYHQPFLAHAAMEPMNCVAQVSADGCEVWTGTQVMGPAQMALSAILKLPPEKVVIHNHPIGGAFGRRLEIDGILACVEIARQVDYPVKLIWTREDDIRGDLYRPAYVDHVEARLDARGRPTAWCHRIAGSSIIARLFPDQFKGVDTDAVECAQDPIYRLTDRRVEFSRVETGQVPTSWWRGVGALRSTFVLESFIDELARKAKVDPAAYRRELLDDPRLVGVLDRVVQMMGWPGARAPGKAQGLAIQKAFKSYGAMIVEITAGKEGFKVDRIGCAIDCGVAVNPRGIEAQVQGGTLFGLSAALSGEITLADGRIEQSNYDTYEVLRLDAAPPVELALVHSDQPPGGLGELPTILVAPALANALAAATGRRLRRLPLRNGLAPN